MLTNIWAAARCCPPLLLRELQCGGVEVHFAGPISSSCGGILLASDVALLRYLLHAPNELTIYHSVGLFALPLNPPLTWDAFRVLSCPIIVCSWPWSSAMWCRALCLTLDVRLSCILCRMSSRTDMMACQKMTPCHKQQR